MNLWVTSLSFMGAWGVSVLGMTLATLGSSQSPRIHPTPVCLWLSPQSGRSHSHPPPFLFQQRVQQDGGRGISEVLCVHRDESGSGSQVRAECVYMCVCGGHQSQVLTDRALCRSATTQRSAGAGRPHDSHLEILLPLK